VILIKPQCRGVAYDCYDWPANPRTYRVAHDYIRHNWHTLEDGDVIDVEYILGETEVPKLSERITENEPHSAAEAATGKYTKQEPADE